MTTSIAKDVKEAALDSVKRIHASLDTLKNGVTYFINSLNDQEESKPITDAEFKQDLTSNLTDVLSTLRKSQRDATRKDLRDFGATIPAETANKKVMALAWTKFLEFEAHTVPDLEKKCNAKLDGLKSNKLAPFHLMDLFPAIEKVQAELQEITALIKSIK